MLGSDTKCINCTNFFVVAPRDGVEILAGTRPGASIRGDNACFSYFSALRDPLNTRSIGDRGINFKASATASS